MRIIACLVGMAMALWLKPIWVVLWLGLGFLWLKSLRACCLSLYTLSMGWCWMCLHPMCTVFAPPSQDATVQVTHRLHAHASDVVFIQPHYPGVFRCHGLSAWEGERWRVHVTRSRPIMDPVHQPYARSRWHHQAVSMRGRLWVKPIRRLRGASLRAHVIQRLSHHHPMQGIYTALVTGETSEIRAEQWQVLRRSGLSHLVAISGLHIVAMASMVSACVTWLFSGTNTYLGRWVGWLCAGWYVWFSGCGIASIRAFSSLTMSTVSHVISRPRSRLGLWAWSILWVCVWRPRCLMQAGFWFSMWSVAYLIMMQSDRRMVLQGRLVLALLPASLWFYHGFSTISVFTNAIAIPWVCHVILPLSWIATWGGEYGEWLHRFTLGLLQGSWSVLQSITAWSGSWHWVTGASAPFCWAWVVMIWTGLPRQQAMHAWAYWPLCVCLLGGGSRMHPGTFRVSVLDVGQGLSVWVQTAKHSLLVDTGPGHGPYHSVFRVIIPHLLQGGVNDLSGLVITHADSDHTGGVQALVDDFPVGWRMTGEVARLWPRLQASPCRTGQVWQWDGVLFRVLSPDSQATGNQASCVLSVSVGTQRVLITGDADIPVLKRLVVDHRSALPSSILVIPHHGALNGWYRPFVEAVHPRWAIASAGVFNRYHHPHVKVMAAYQAMGVQVLQTNRHGTSTWFCDAKHCVM